MYTHKQFHSTISTASRTRRKTFSLGGSTTSSKSSPSNTTKSKEFKRNSKGLIILSHSRYLENQWNFTLSTWGVGSHPTENPPESLPYIKSHGHIPRNPWEPLTHHLSNWRWPRLPNDAIPKHQHLPTSVVKTKSWMEPRWYPVDIYVNAINVWYVVMYIYTRVKIFGTVTMYWFM